VEKASGKRSGRETTLLENEENEWMTRVRKLVEREDGERRDGTDLIASTVLSGR